MTGIDWTDATWNPVTGCDRVSPGCDHCYALTMAGRLKAMGQAKYQTDGRPETSGPGFGVQCHPETLDTPLRWRKPRRVFVNSMSDLFHPQVPDEFIASVFATMAVTPQHTYQILTKRPQRMRSILTDQFLGEGLRETVMTFAQDHYVVFDARMGDPDFASHPRRRQETFDRRYPPAWPLPNVWLGVSVEDQQRADQRIPSLLDTPAAVRFLSCEPLLGPVDLTLGDWEGLPDHDPIGIHWVIVGGESGPRARPMCLSWAAEIVRQCQEADVPVFVKQLGSRPRCGPDTEWAVTGKGGDPAQWPPELRVRQWPQTKPVEVDRD